jgi:hypothetical protein
MKVRLLALTCVLAAAGDVYLIARWPGVLLRGQYWSDVLHLGILATSIWWAVVQRQRHKASRAPKR